MSDPRQSNDAAAYASSRLPALPGAAAPALSPARAGQIQTKGAAPFQAGRTHTYVEGLLLLHLSDVVTVVHASLRLPTLTSALFTACVHRGLKNVMLWFAGVGNHGSPGRAWRRASVMTPRGVQAWTSSASLVARLRRWRMVCTCQCRTHKSSAATCARRRPLTAAARGAAAPARSVTARR